MSQSPNGCGPEWLPQWIKSALFDWFHEASCDKHDEGYAEGGNEARRAECDRKFWEAMTRDSLRHNGLSRFVRLSQAVVFYGLVRALGWMQFNYKD